MADLLRAARELLVIPVSANFSDTLGVHAALGHTFTPDDERGGGCTVVLSHAFWTESLGADASVTYSASSFTSVPCSFAMSCETRS